MLSEESQEELARNIAVYLNEKGLTKTIIDYLDYKIIKLYKNLSQDKRRYFFQWWEETIEKMMNVGMLYYTFQSVQKFKNIIRQEMQCFRNLIDILRGLMSISKRKYIMRSTKKLRKYMEICRLEYSEEIEKDNMRLDFKNINLAYLDLKKINLSYTCLNDTNLKGANLTEANLTGANLVRADFRGADLTDTNLSDAELEASIWYMADVCKAYHQLRTVAFDYIVVNDRYENQKKLYKNELQEMKETIY